MKYIVEVGYLKFGYFDSSTTAINWAEIAKQHSIDGYDVIVKVLSDEEVKDNE